ncbi:MAG: hypothetical protein K9N55_13630 [Phycisphaerae bacterium]|nr:hypothetical protein [Phycisphaerae bacterium]
MEDATVDVSIDYVGKYIWRGQVLTDDPAIQPAVSVGMDKLTFGVWGSMDMTNWNGHNNPQAANEYSDRYEFREVEYMLDYTDALPGVDGVNYSAGAILYHFPTTKGPTNATTEFYAGLGFDTILNPTATLYYDIDDTDGFYASFGISHSLDLSEMGLSDDMVKSLDLAASLGWADRNSNGSATRWGTTVDAINDLVISATVPVELCEAATLNVSCNYVSLLDSSIKRTTATQKSDYVYAGIGVAMSF